MKENSKSTTMREGEGQREGEKHVHAERRDEESQRERDNESGEKGGRRTENGRERRRYLIYCSCYCCCCCCAFYAYCPLFLPGKQQLWNDDQGFFKINQVLAGDFVVIARFKGTDGGAETGPDGVLFRYCNHTCFLPAGQVMLRKRQVRICWCWCGCWSWR